MSDDIKTDNKKKSGDLHFENLIAYLKRYFCPTDDFENSLQITTGELYDTLQSHYPADYTELDVYDALCKLGFKYGNCMSDGIRFVWYLKQV